MLAEIRAYPWEPFDETSISSLGGTLGADSTYNASGSYLLINSLRINVPDPSDPNAHYTYLYGINDDDEFRTGTDSSSKTFWKIDFTPKVIMWRAFVTIGNPANHFESKDWTMTIGNVQGDITQNPVFGTATAETDWSKEINLANPTEFPLGSVLSIYKTGIMAFKYIGAFGCEHSASTDCHSPCYVTNVTWAIAGLPAEVLVG